jgi:hypothetical protein
MHLIVCELFNNGMKRVFDFAEIEADNKNLKAS